MKSIKLIVLFAFIILCFFSVFKLPFLVKPFQIAVSSAYDYGFNNSMAIFSIIVFTLAGAIIILTSFKSIIENEKDFDLLDVNHKDRMNPKHFGIIFTIYFLVILVLYLLNAQRGYGEANYFFGKLDRLYLKQAPYIDFEYAYGLLFLYLPKYLLDFIKAFGLGPKEAYYFVFLLLNLIGLYSLYHIVNLLNITAKRKTIIFYAIALPAFPISLGFNYIFIRFITPFVCIIILDHVFKKLDGYRWRTQAVLLALVSFLTILNFLISTEIGTVFFIATSIYLFLTLLSTRNRYLLLLILVYLITFSIFLGTQKNYFLALNNFSAGGNNFAIVPSPSILIYLISLLFISSLFSARYLRYRKDLLLFVLTILNISMMPGALGRCDPIHVFWYGIGVFVVTMAYLAKLSLPKLRLFKIYGVSFILVFGLGMTFSGVYLWKEDLSRIFVKRIESSVSQERILKLATRSAELLKMDKDNVRNRLEKHFQGRKVNVSELLSRYEKIATPLFIDADTYEYLIRNDKYVPEYYSGLLNVFTVKQIAAKMSTLEDEAHKYILINEECLGLNHRQSIKNEANERKMISWLFLYPFNLKKVRNTSELYLPLYDYITSNYEMICKIRNSVLLERKIDRAFGKGFMANE
jgi:hypothetical protein